LGLVKNSGIKIAGIACAVPDNPQSIFDIGAPYFDREFIEKINKNVGTETLYFTGDNQSSADLGIAAAEELFRSLDWDRSSVDGLFFVSQTLDYVVPPTSCKVQAALGLSKECFVMDTNYGCPGYVQNLMVAAQLIQSGMCHRILIINAECHHKYISRTDESTALIFGDGAAATAMESCDRGNGNEAYFLTATNGNYVEDLVLGNYKKPKNPSISDFNHVYMDGEKLTKYMFKEIPGFCMDLLAMSDIELDSIDSFLFHQANAYMIRYLARRMKIHADRVPVNIGAFGNTSGPSIPLLICDKKRGLFEGENEKTMMLSYGAGYQIAGAVIDVGNLHGGQIITV
jgi:3-oxoacyl-[acyl-carrier-protein] synthase-3